MKNLLFIFILLAVYKLNGQTKIGSSSTPVTFTNDPTCTGCVDLPAKLTIADAQADGSTKGAATFFGLDFNSSSGLISIDYPNAQLATGSQNGFVAWTGTQTFGGIKIFDGNVSLASTRTLSLWNGSETTPSLLFSDNNTGFGFLTTPSNTCFLSFDGIYRYQFLSGEFDMKNCANFVAGAGKLDINITHDADSESPKQDGGVSVSTYSGTETKTCTFGGRTANGTESGPASTILDQAMVEFIGKGYVLCPFEDPADCDDYGFEHTNRGVFGVYASETHSLSSQGAYCAIQTTRIGTTNDHFSFLIDAAGNGGLTYNKIIPIAYPDLWSDGTDPEDDYDSRFFTVESETNTTDVGLFLQNNNAAKGINIWLDNDQDISYFDNIRNSNGAAFKFRLKTAGTSVTAMTINAHGSNIGGGTPASGETFSVGSNRDLIVNSSGKLSKYQNSTISDGELLIGKTSGSTFEKATLTGSSGISVTSGSGSVTLSGFGYSEQFGFGQFNPNDAANYYGGGQVQSSGTTAGVSRIYIPKTGTIKVCYVVFDNAGTLGSSESSTISIRVENTTDYTVSSTVTNDSRPTVFSNTSMSVPVTAGQYIEIKWFTPTWATNPTSVRLSGTIYIE